MGLKCRLSQQTTRTHARKEDLKSSFSFLSILTSFFFPFSFLFFLMFLFLDSHFCLCLSLSSDHMLLRDKRWSVGLAWFGLGVSVCVSVWCVGVAYLLLTCMLFFQGDGWMGAARFGRGDISNAMRGDGRKGNETKQKRT